MKIQKPPALLIIVGILILPIVLLANSSSGAPTTLKKKIRHRLAALMSADVVGHSKLMAQDEVGRIRTLIAYRAEMTALVKSRGGRVVNFVGDNMLQKTGL